MGDATNLTNNPTLLQAAGASLLCLPENFSYIGTTDTEVPFRRFLSRGRSLFLALQRAAWTLFCSPQLGTAPAP